LSRSDPDNLSFPHPQSGPFGFGKGGSFTSVALVAILSLTFYLRLLFFGQIIDADVGNLAYLGWRMAEGEVLIDLEGPGKPPLYPILYALFVWFFGPSVLGIKVFGALFVLMAVIAIYWVGNKAYGRGIGLLSALLFGVFSSAPMVEGGTVNLETLLHFPSLLSIGFFLNGLTSGQRRWYFLAGLFGAMTVLVKQVGGILFLAFLCSEIHKGWRVKEGIIRLSFLGGGALVPVMGLLFFYSFHGYTLHQVYDVLLGSNFRYLQRGYEYRSLWLYFFLSVGTILLENSLLWIGTIFSTIFLMFRMAQGRGEAVDRILLWWAFWSFGVLWISGTFYAHYFLQLIAPFSLLTAFAIVTVWRWAKTSSSQIRWMIRVAWMVLLIIPTVLFVKTDYPYFFSYHPVEQTVHQYKGLYGIFDHYGYGVFSVVQQEIAFYIRDNTHPSDTIYVWGVSPQLYFLAQRRAATRYRTNFNISLNVTDNPAKELRAYAPVVMEDLRLSPPAYIVQIFDLENFPELQWFVQERYQAEIMVEVPGTSLRIHLFRRRI